MTVNLQQGDVTALRFFAGDDAQIDEEEAFALADINLLLRARLIWLTIDDNDECSLDATPKGLALLRRHL